MRAHLILIFLFASTFAHFVKIKPHEKLALSKSTAKEVKDVIAEKANKGQVLPTFVPFEASSQEDEDEEMNIEANANIEANTDVSKEDRVSKRGVAIPAVLLSEEELADLLKLDSIVEDTDEEKREEVEVEEEEEEVKEEADVNKRATESEEAVGIADVEEDEEDGGTLKEIVKKEEEEKAETEAKLKGEEESDMLETKDEVEKMSAKMSVMELEKDAISYIAGGAEQVEEETDGSTDLEIPVNPDYVADRDISVPLKHVESVEVMHYADDTLISTKPLEDPDVREKEELANDKEIPSTSDDYEQDIENAEASESDETANELIERKYESSLAKSEERDHIEKEPRGDVYLQELESSVVLEDKNNQIDPQSHAKGKRRKQKKNQRAKKRATQSDEPQPGHEERLQDSQESEVQPTENTVQKAKRRRTGKWAHLVGMNPVQIRATVDLYPSTRPSSGVEEPAGPCDNFHCKRGRTCKLDSDNKPTCGCQEPSECPHTVNTFDRVCGTDNKTYDTSCELFATKCNMEGTKKGHKLHLDYTGPCKFIAPCLDNELVQFPLRMRDWLKNVLLQLYERDSVSPGFLTAKQRVRVKKIYENERGLHAGDHAIDLLAQDFEKNYNMYIYPVHWQFAQMDQHPFDRFLSHSELAPLRVPLVPMEHCTSRFFQECDADKDKQVSFKEWAHCFSIKDEDMNVNLLF